jgi:hypothetical protein
MSALLVDATPAKQDKNIAYGALQLKNFIWIFL